MKKREKLSFWKNIFPFIKDDKAKLIFCMVCAVIVGVFVAFQPLVIKYIVDNGILSTTMSKNEKLLFVGFLSLLYAVISIARSVMWRIGYKKMVKVMENTLLRLRSALFSHIQSVDMKFHETNSSGELFNYIMGSPMINIKAYLNSIFMALPYQSVSMVISLFALVYYDWVLTAVLFLTAFAMAVFSLFSRRKMRSVYSEYLTSEADASKYISDKLKGMDAVKLYSVEEHTFNSFKSTVTVMREKGIKATLSQHLSALLIEQVQFLGTAVVYFVGAVSCITRGVSVGVLYAFLSSMGTIMGILYSWLTLGLTRTSAESGLEKILGVLKSQTSTPEIEESLRKNIDVEKNRAISKHTPCIEFKNIDFSYENKQVFKNFNCSIQYGESVALVGCSGSGKSTLVNLAMRIYDVQNGKVFIHGNDIREYGLHELRTSFGIVPQEPFIFYGSIWENIKTARPDASNNDIIKAMEIAHVHEFVNDLPSGWNTIIGDGGLDLSGGQKQRIAIARAVLGKPDVLIFDEATSALDNISEKAIRTSVEELMKTHTVIIIAHRLSTVKNVDRILVLDNGKVVEEGSYSVLSKKENGVFSALLDASE